MGLSCSSAEFHTHDAHSACRYGSRRGWLVEAWFYHSLITRQKAKRQLRSAPWGGPIAPVSNSVSAPQANQQTINRRELPGNFVGGWPRERPCDRKN